LYSKLRFLERPTHDNGAHATGQGDNAVVAYVEGIVKFLELVERQPGKRNPAEAAIRMGQSPGYGNDPDAVAFATHRRADQQMVLGVRLVVTEIFAVGVVQAGQPIDRGCKQVAVLVE
jgi:hypothetical protein